MCGMMTKEDYNDIPVFYCKNCLSLAVVSIESYENVDFCKECGSTNIDRISIREWEKLYYKKYGHRYVDNN